CWWRAPTAPTHTPHGPSRPRRAGRAWRSPRPGAVASSVALLALRQRFPRCSLRRVPGRRLPACARRARWRVLHTSCVEGKTWTSLIGTVQEGENLVTMLRDELSRRRVDDLAVALRGQAESRRDRRDAILNFVKRLHRLRLGLARGW